MQTRALRITIIASCALWACGGDGDANGAGPKTSGVDVGKQLTALSDDDARALCEFDRDSYKAALPDETAYCTYFAAYGDAELCEQDRDDCIADDEYENEVADDWECDSSRAEDYNGGLQGECTATVGDVEACLRADSRNRGEAMQAATCEEYADEGDEALEPCVTLRDKCPGFFN
jgi:hypothetical protein